MTLVNESGLALDEHARHLIELRSKVDQFPSVHACDATHSTPETAMTLTAARAQLVLDLARRHTAADDVAAAITVVDAAADLVGCCRTDGAPPQLLDESIELAKTAAVREYGGETYPLRTKPLSDNGVGLIPAWTPQPGDIAPLVGVLSVVTITPGAGADIVQAVVADVRDFDSRHRLNVS
ncbi:MULTISPECIES: heme-binding protein [unclassified Rhodococcus (in: high G+C Gram-positive bacteria)]|jgi:uncharacterized protein GlcG (DUF336 family)|uniref:heme-binding protein n=1 Tax=unclassified Rhodococcus (in: high G+C Gram-positive bacteria) TaxID=192944 RepID=UPI0003021657|nr:heme-binding protein [Rhodococcus sp. DK17]